MPGLIKRPLLSRAPRRAPPADAEQEIPFISSDDQKPFVQPGRRLTRYVRSLDAEAGISALKNAQRLENAALGEVREWYRMYSANQKMKPQTICRVIQVRDGDGMSWSAAHIDQIAARDFPDLARIHFCGDQARGGLPEIAQLVSPRKFAVLAHKSGVTDKFGFLDLRISAILALVIVVLGLLVAALTARLPETAGNSWIFVPIAIIIAVLSPVIQLLLTRVQLGPFGAPSDDIGKLADELRPPKTIRNLPPFVRLLTSRLRKTHLPRLVIIDGFDQVSKDTLTREVIVRYLADNAPASRAFEAWIIFERLGASELWNRKLKSESGGFAGIHIHEQDVLSEEDRLRLALRVGNPDRSDLETIKAICSPDETPRWDKEFSKYAADHQSALKSPGALDFFYLLSLAFAWGGSPPIDDDYIEQNFHPTGLELLRLDVLRLLIPKTRLSTDVLRARLDEILSEGIFKPFVVLRNDGRPHTRAFRILPEVGRWLAQNSDKYDLLPPERLHVFWALFWDDNIRGSGSKSAFWTQKLAAHLRRATPVTGLPEIVEPKVRERLFEIDLATTEASLSQSLLDDVPHLLDRARSLVGSGAKWHRSVERLGRQSWKAFALTGEDPILTTINRLPAASTKPSGTAPDPLEVLFLQSLHLRASLASGSEDRAAKLYARLRLIWLGMTLDRFADASTPLLNLAGGHTVQQLVNQLDLELRRLQARPRAEAIDSVNLSILLWCIILRVGRELSPQDRSVEAVRGIVNVLEATLDFIEQHPSLTTAEGTEEAGVVEVMLSRELALLACSAVIFLRREKLPGLNQAELVMLVRRSLQGAKVSQANLRLDEDPNLIAAIDSHLDLIHVIWARFGLRQLSSFTNLWRAHLRLLKNDGSDPVELRKECEDALRPELHPPIEAGMPRIEASRLTAAHVSLLARAILADSAWSTREVAGNHLLRAVDQAIDDRLGDPLLTELCLLAIRVAGPFQGNFDNLVEHLVIASTNGGHPSPTAFKSMLDQFPARLVPFVANWMLGAVRNSDRPRLIEEVIKLLDACIVDLDSSTADAVRRQLELFRLNRAIAMHEPVDIEQALRDWETRTTTPDYPGLLFELTKASKIPPNALVEASLTFFSEASGDFTSTAPVLLAWVIGSSMAMQDPDSTEPEDSLRRRAIAASVAFLRRWLPFWEGLVGVRVTTSIRAFLITHDPAGADEHRRELSRLTKLKMESDAITTLPTLVSKGQFFQLWWHYYETLNVWGLHTDLTAAEIRRRLTLGPPEQKAAIAGWNSQPPPGPFVDREGKRCLHAEFLIRGHYLFSPAALQDKDLDELRSSYNRAARQGISELFSELENVQSIPAELKAILKRHREDLQAPALPPQGPTDVTAKTPAVGGSRRPATKRPRT
jgi:hypothetical protein